MSPWRVGLLGLDEPGLLYRDALRASDRFELVAMADGNADRVRHARGESDVVTYEDCRSLVVAQSRDPIDALFVTLPVHQSVELMPLAAERRLPVFHHVPFARTADEGRRLVQTFLDANCPFAAARPWTANPTCATTRDVLDQIGRVVAAHAFVPCRQTVAGWRGDTQRAGGGVLLHVAYESVDAMVALLGLPESVFAECGAITMPGSPRGHATEDVAAVTLRFSRGEIGSVTTWRGGETDRPKLTLIGTDGAVSITPVCGVSAATDPEYADALRQDIESFGDALRHDPSPAGMPAAARHHLNTLATIEAAYLSAKTGSPELPAQYITDLVR